MGRTQARYLALLIFVVSSATAQDRLRVEAGFETGQIQRVGESVDGGFIQTLPDPQNGSDFIKSGSGGCGPTSDCDLRVVESEVVNGQRVKARSGKYFLRILLDKEKDYTGLNGGGLPKPRNSLGFYNPEYRFSHDTEEWVGFSVFLPEGFEDETENIGIILSEITVDSSAQFIKLSVGMRGGDTESHWYLDHYQSDTSVAVDADTVKTEYQLGSIEGDKGRWTDFILRIRANPFRVDTNPAKKGIPDAFDRMYRGNKGILQVWKAVGSVDSAGNREMVNVVDIVNAPVGLVPGTTQGKSKIAHNARAYKPAWQGHTGRSSSVVGPIWIGWDEFRFGSAVADGTSYQDVHPAGLRCTDRCPDGEEPASTPDRPLSPPKAPNVLGP